MCIVHVFNDWSEEDILSRILFLSFISKTFYDFTIIIIIIVFVFISIENKNILMFSFCICQCLQSMGDWSWNEKKATEAWS